MVRRRDPLQRSACQRAAPVPRPLQRSRRRGARSPVGACPPERALQRYAVVPAGGGDRPHVHPDRAERLRRLRPRVLLVAVPEPNPPGGRLHNRVITRYPAAPVGGAAGPPYARDRGGRGVHLLGKDEQVASDGHSGVGRGHASAGPTFPVTPPSSRRSRPCRRHGDRHVRSRGVSAADEPPQRDRRTSCSTVRSSATAFGWYRRRAGSCPAHGRYASGQEQQPRLGVLPFDGRSTGDGLAFAPDRMTRTRLDGTHLTPRWTGLVDAGRVTTAGSPRRSSCPVSGPSRSWSSSDPSLSIPVGEQCSPTPPLWARISSITWR